MNIFIQKGQGKQDCVNAVSQQKRSLRRSRISSSLSSSSKLLPHNGTPRRQHKTRRSITIRGGIAAIEQIV